MTPFTVLGGYLGAGKTTLLNQLLHTNSGSRLAVIVNDFGDIGIDADLVVLDEASGESAPFTRGGATSEPVVSVARPRAEDAFRSAYRLSEDGLVLLDQRAVPERLDEVVARRGSDVAYYLRLGVARGGPLMAQVAAYGLALTADERRQASPDALRAELRRTRQALVEARPSGVAALTWVSGGCFNANDWSGWDATPSPRISSTDSPWLAGATLALRRVPRRT